MWKGSFSYYVFYFFIWSSAFVLGVFGGSWILQIPVFKYFIVIVSVVIFLVALGLNLFYQTELIINSWREGKA